MIGYTFVFGVDGFGADTAPAYEEGVFLNYEKAFAHFKMLTQRQLEMTGRKFYEEGYGEDYWPDEHVLHDIDAICNHIIHYYDDPPFDFYQMVEVEIIE